MKCLCCKKEIVDNKYESVIIHGVPFDRRPKSDFPNSEHAICSECISKQYIETAIDFKPTKETTIMPTFYDDLKSNSVLKRDAEKNKFKTSDIKEKNMWDFIISLYILFIARLEYAIREYKIIRKPGNTRKKQYEKIVVNFIIEQCNLLPDEVKKYGNGDLTICKNLKTHIVSHKTQISSNNYKDDPREIEKTIKDLVKNGKGDTIENIFVIANSVDTAKVKEISSLTDAKKAVIHWFDELPKDNTQKYRQQIENEIWKLKDKYNLVNLKRVSVFCLSIEVEKMYEMIQIIRGKIE